MRKAVVIRLQLLLLFAETLITGSSVSLIHSIALLCNLLQLNKKDQ